MVMMAINTTKENTLMGFLIFRVVLGNLLANQSPKSNGIAKMTKIVSNISIKLNEKFKSPGRLGENEDQKVKLKGVITTATKVAMAVNETDNAGLPLAINEKKLETLIDHPTLYKKYDGWFLLNFQPEEVQDDSRALVGKVVQKTPDSEIELITKEVSKLFRFNVLVKIVSN